MKKIVGIIAAAALAASAFAEVNIGSWNRGAFIPVAYDGDTIKSMEGANWDGSNSEKYGVRTGLSFSASSDDVAGVAMDVFASSGTDGMGLSVGDNAYVWVRPISMLRVAFGQIDNNWGRLDHCFGTWDHSWRFSIDQGEGLAGVERQKGTGANFTLTPVEGLVIDYQANMWLGGNQQAYKPFWEASSLMIGYQADFGFIRAIINGQKAANTYKDADDFAEDKTTPSAKISVAADITAIENVVLKVGATVPTNLTGFSVNYAYDTNGDIDWTKTTYSANNVKIGAGVDVALDPVSIHAQATVAINPKEVDDGKVKLGEIGLNLGAGVDFAINDMFTLITDVRFTTDKWNYSSLTYGTTEFTYDDSAFGAYLGLAQKLSNATFDFGVELGKNVGPSNVGDDFTFAVPLMITMGF